MAAPHCPYCQYPIKLKDLQPGRSTISCPKCRHKFLLDIPADASRPMAISGLKTERAAYEAKQAARQAATVPAPESEPEPDPNATVEQPSTVARPVAPSEKPSTLARPLPSDAETADLGASQDADKPAASADVPTTLGGYQVVQELGRGGMGAVYLAKQVSLGRNVALKVMKPEWARNPTFLARFTREAYAAAQLNHHNIVQIYDFGEDKGTSYFSMEFVEGQNLLGLIREQKKLDPEVAVGYVLQAARGLKYAHDQSMIHRDIKPENLMLNAHGVVKVADLGLVKSPRLAEELDKLEAAGSTVATASEAASDPNLTRADVAMGTPAYMAPEQGRDAAHVDARADIYSLGCTLYTLVTGRPPFEGRTALEIITKHQTEPIPPPEQVAKRVPKELSEIILRMVAKQPEDRFQDLGEVIRALEGFLGVTSASPFTPKEEHAEALERAVVRYHNSPAASLKPKIVAGFLGLMAFMVVANILMGWPILAGGFLGLAVLTVLAYFVVDGLARGSIVFTKARALVLSSRPIDWLTMLAGLLVLLGVLWALKLLWVWVAFCVAAVLLALTMSTMVDRRIDAERAEARDSAEALLKRLRLQGVEEDALRQFVFKYGGERWEPLYEDLFGYEAKLDARARWSTGTAGRSSRRHGTWREPIVAWIDARLAARRAAKDRMLLQKIEERNLCARGENLVTARRKAHRVAEAMVATASEARARPGRDGAPGIAVAKAVRDAARQPEKVLVECEKGHLYGPRGGGWLDIVLGQRVRFLAGAALLFGFLVWMNQNDILSRRHVETLAQQVSEAAKAKDLEAIQEAGRSVASDVQGRVASRPQTEPLRVPGLPRSVRGLFNGFGPGVAGLILLVSSFFRGWRMSLFAIPAAVVAVAGPRLGLPVIGPLSATQASLALAMGVGALGLVFGRSRH